MNYRVDGSPTSPVPVRKVIKISEIPDRKEKLKAYRIEKNTRKLQEIQEQRSPFVLAVPVGRWVEKKERTRPVQIELNNTPIKAALNERVLKKSTVKNILLKSTAKKENLVIFNGKKNENSPAKAKKKILVELNAAATSNILPEEAEQSFNLNSTFEISPEKEEEVQDVKPSSPQRLRRSKSYVDVAQAEIDKVVERKANTPPTKQAAAKKKVMMKRQMTVTIKKPVVVTKPAPVVRKEVPIKRQVTAVVSKKVPQVKPSKSAIAEIATTVSQVPLVSPTKDEDVPQIAPPKPVAKKKEPQRSHTYSLYNSSLNTQINFLTMELNNLTSSKDSFIEHLSEDQQLTVNEAIQQGNLLITDKLGKFAEFLNKFEDDLNRPDDPKRVTDDDVENYWFLIYEEIEKLKGDLANIQNMKKTALAVLASAKKRRTRRTYIPDDGTPKRSRRIAGNAETPK